MCLVIKFLFFFLISQVPEGDVKVSEIEREVRKYMDQANENIYTDPSKAVFYANNARIKAEHADHQLLVCDALVLLGRSYVNLGSFDMAFEAFYNAYDKCPPEEKGTLADISVSIANLYKSLKDIKKSFHFIELATTIYTSLNDTAGMAACFNAKGLLYESMEADEEAEKNFKQALALNRTLGDQKAIAKNLNNMCLYEGGNIREKIELLNEAILINKVMGANWSLAENYNNLGTLYFYIKDYTRALEWLEIALINANELSARELICDNYRYQSWVYSGMGNYKKAYENLLKVYKLEGEMLSEKKIREIELNVADRRFQMQQKELSLKKKEFQIRSLKKDIIVIISIAFGCLVFFVYLFLHGRQKKKMQMMETEKRLEMKEKEMMELQLNRTEGERRNFELELDHSKKELTNFACYVRSKNELLEKIKEMIKEIYKDIPDESKAQLKTINAFITQYQHKENDTGTWMVEIDRVNAEFIAHLTTLHPNLSKNEKQLASLLRIDLTTKEIALLIGSIPKTVNMARYRLRQKLEIESDEKLSEYMKKM